MTKLSESFIRTMALKMSNPARELDGEERESMMLRLANTAPSNTSSGTHYWCSTYWIDDVRIDVFEMANDETIVEIYDDPRRNDPQYVLELEARLRAANHK